MLEPGNVLQGRYRIEDQIGQGGMGTVYLARQVRLADRAVAIKELKPSGVRPEERAHFVRQFQREARILATLQHPGLVDVKDFFEENQWLYLVMDYIDGRSLAQIVREPADQKRILETIDWALQLTEVLHYLHNHSPVIVVRDLKPGNIMVQRDGRIRLIDFGIAREFQDSASDTSTSLKGAGSPGFAPPEQYGSNTDPRTDIYALGATLYAVITAKVPPVSVVLMTGEELLRPLHEANRLVSPRLSKVIHHMMSLKRDDRPQNVDIVESLLREAREAQLAFDRGEDVDSGPLAAVPTRLLPTERVCTQCGLELFSPTDPCPNCNSMIPEATPEEEEALRQRQASYWQNVLPPSAEFPPAPPPPPPAGRWPPAPPLGKWPPAPPPPPPVTPGPGPAPLAVPRVTAAAAPRPASPPPARPQPPLPPPDPPPPLMRWIVAAITISLVAAFLWHLHSLGQPPSLTLASSSVQYKDPDGHYTLTIPSGWRYGSSSPLVRGVLPERTRLVMVAPSMHQFVAVECFTGAGTAAAALDLIKAWGVKEKLEATYTSAGTWTTDNGLLMDVYRTKLAKGELTGNSAFFVQGQDVWRLLLLANSGFSVPDPHIFAWSPAP